MVSKNMSDDEENILEYVCSYIIRSLKKTFNKAKQTQIYSCGMYFIPWRQLKKHMA